MIRLIQVSYVAFWNGKLGKILDTTDDGGKEIFFIPTLKEIETVRRKRELKRTQEQLRYEDSMKTIKPRKAPKFNEEMTLENKRELPYYFNNQLDKYVVEDD
ncbi:MAG: hypothetical protein EZS28_044510 [Streblomastix strix]|uniref:Uncharacterized protein n=1 Tax=Streblomastix strix TaxID=222440 RepID=A0A5J4TPZ2_9EUKA|nr:MAG: hypothetical protein EZS28_044510 [Streblomastix strix]